MKGKLIIGLVIVLMLALALPFGCAKEEVAPPVEKPKPPVEEPRELITLVATTYVPPTYQDVFLAIPGFVDRVNELGKGKVKIDFYHSGTLLGPKEEIPGLMAGTADIIFQTTSYEIGAWPIMGILTLPVLWPDPWQHYEKWKIGSPLYNLINEELAKKNVFMIAPGPLDGIEYLWTVKKPVRTLADIKGMRLRTAGMTEGKAAEALGASSVTMPSGEVYLALQRGTVDGVLCYVGTIPARSLQEVLKYGTTGISFGSYGHEPFMRKDKWDALPQDVKDVILEAGKWYEKEAVNSGVNYHKEHYWPILRKELEIIELTPKEIDAFTKAMKPVWDWWIGTVGPEVGNKAIELALK